MKQWLKPQIDEFQARHGGHELPPGRVRPSLIGADRKSVTSGGVAQSEIAVNFKRIEFI